MWYSKDGRGVQHAMKLLCENRNARDVRLKKYWIGCWRGRRVCWGGGGSDKRVRVVSYHDNNTAQHPVTSVLGALHNTAQHTTAQDNRIQQNQTFNRVLNTFINISFMQNASEPFKDGMQPLGGKFF